MLVGVTTSMCVYVRPTTPTCIVWLHVLYDSMHCTVWLLHVRVWLIHVLVLLLHAYTYIVLRVHARIYTNCKLAGRTTTLARNIMVLSLPHACNTQCHTYLVTAMHAQRSRSNIMRACQAYVDSATLWRFPLVKSAEIFPAIKEKLSVSDRYVGEGTAPGWTKRFPGLRRVVIVR